MPITQSRMLSLLAAAQDYADAMERFWSICTETRNRFQQGEITAAQAVDLMAISIRPELMLQFPYQSPTVLKLEAKHFAMEKRRNERKTEKARENRERAAMGLPPPNRGTGKEHGWKGGSRRGGAPIHPLSIQPDPEASMPTRVRVREEGVRSAPPPKHLSELEALALAGLNETGDLEADFGGSQEVPVEERLDEETLRQVTENLHKIEAEEAVNIALGITPNKETKK